MDNCKYYEFLSAKVDIENGFKKIYRGEKLDKEDREALEDIIKMVTDFMEDNDLYEQTFIEKQ